MRCSTILGLSVALVAAVPLAAQQTSEQRIEAARQLLERSEFDSAAALLRDIIDHEPAARLQAYVWLGIVEHFAGRDSLARAAFRRAYLLDPGLELKGVGDLDPPRLPALLAEERAAARGDAPAVAPPAAAGAGAAGAADSAPRPGAHESTMARCLPGCTGLRRVPEFQSMPRVAFPDHLADAARQLDLVVRLVVDSTGKVAKNSVEIVRSNVASAGGDILSALARARFRPGQTAQGPTQVLVELTFRSKSQGAAIVLAAPDALR